MMPIVPNGAPRFVEQSHGQGAGWLGPTFDPMRIDADGSKPDYKVGDFVLQSDVPEMRSIQRRQLLASVDQQLRALEMDPRVTATQSHYDRAFSLLSITRCDRSFRSFSRANGGARTLRDEHSGQSVLQARRLVEAGVPFVTVFWPNDGLTNVSVYWDTHNRNFIDLKTRLCPVTDQAFSALLDDLQQRGMLDENFDCLDGRNGAYAASWSRSCRRSRCWSRWA